MGYIDRGRIGIARNEIRLSHGRQCQRTCDTKFILCLNAFTGAESAKMSAAGFEESKVAPEPEGAPNDEGAPKDEDAP